MVWSKVKKKVWQSRSSLLIASTISILVTLGSLTSLYESFDLSILDFWFRIRPSEKRESRVVVIGVDELDIRNLEQWPISDGQMADLLEIVSQQEPRVIGLDIYRDLPQGDSKGQQRLADVFTSTPNIIGVEKVIGEKVHASPLLKQAGQTAMADLVVDRDGKIRRGLISIRTTDDQVILGLATRLALTYLIEENIALEAAKEEQHRVLGKAVFRPILSNEGGYSRADIGGYQVILNWRGDESKFTYTSLTEVLTGKVPANLFQDKVVLIGATASSLNDLFYTPFTGKGNNFTQMPGVYIHANLASQIISSALDGRTLIEGTHEFKEWLMVITWAFIGVGISLLLVFESSLSKKTSIFPVKSIVIGLFLPVGILLGINYGLFLTGIWLPTVAPLLAFTLSTIATRGYHNQNQKNLAFTDGLTQIANRRFFDRYLEQQWLRIKRDNRDISLILCDVDFFKVYNDTYGHQAGDECLQKVAKAIRESVRTNDLSARYGGEEFVVVLPNTDSQTAILVAHRIRFILKEMRIPHENSRVSSFVTISCGVASIKQSNSISPTELIANADRALYSAKEQGRDCAIIAE